MKRLLVVFHIYYPEQTAYFIGKLRNINGCSWDLVVTSPKFDDESVRLLREFKPDVRFEQVDNIGYDVWPFIKVIKQTDLSAYDYVLKLHTKSATPDDKINGLKLQDYRWRDMLVDSLLKSPSRFRRCLRIFASSPEVGMIYSYELRCDLKGGYPENKSMLEAEVRRIGLDRDVRHETFCAGTIFMARSAVFGRIQRIRLTDDMWGTHFASHSAGSLAHVYERLLTIMVKDAGYKVRNLRSGNLSYLSVFFHKKVGAVLKFLLTIQRDENSDKYLILLGKRFYFRRIAGRLRLSLRVAVHGHLLNWLWRSRVERRRVRGLVTADAISRYLDRYVPEFREVPRDPAPEAEPERIFSIWFQGEENAPSIVKACWRSIKANAGVELVVLDSKSVFDWISLPDYIVDKWKDGKIRPPHFADICRIELLYRYGGYWMDSTDFVTEPLPQWVKDQDFFVYMAGGTLCGWYAFIQNCFIRGRKGNYLLKAWREAVYSYWWHEDSVVDYFVHQQLFRKAVECNPEAAAEFAKMPRVVQDPTHTLWYPHASEPYDPELFRKLTSAAIFQKTEYKSEAANNPLPGTLSDAMQKMF